MTSTKHQRRQLIEKGYTPVVELANWNEEDLTVLRRYGAWFEALGLGKVEASTDLQHHFMMVAQGLLAPKTKYEVLWRRYLLAIRQVAIDGDVAFVDVVATRKISQLNTEIGRLRLENEVLRSKVNVLETQLGDSQKARQLVTENRRLVLENEALHRKAEVLETQLATTHKTLAKYELPPNSLVIDHATDIQKRQKSSPQLPKAQIVYASTDGQD